MTTLEKIEKKLGAHAVKKVGDSYLLSHSLLNIPPNVIAAILAAPKQSAFPVDTFVKLKNTINIVRTDSMLEGRSFGPFRRAQKAGM